MKIKIKSSLLIASSLIATCFSTTAMAEGTTTSNFNPIVTAIAIGTVNILGNYNTLFRAIGMPFMASQAAFFPATAAQSYLTTSHLVSLQSSQDTANFIFGAVTPPRNSNQPTVVGIPISYSPGVYAAMVPVARTPVALAQIRYLSVGSLVSTSKFQSNQQQLEASTFIRFLADAGGKVQALPSATLDAANTTAKNQYLNLLANYNAGQSVGLNTLYNLYNERIPLPQLNGESILSSDEKLAMHGMQPQWQAAVAKMTPVDLLRQNVYEQALNNYQTFQLRMAIEQLNTNIAVMQLIQQQSVAKPILAISAQNVASSAVATNKASQ